MRENCKKAVVQLRSILCFFFYKRLKCLTALLNKATTLPMKSEKKEIRQLQKTSPIRKRKTKNASLTTVPVKRMSISHETELL